MPKELRGIVNASPLVLLMPLVLVIPASSYEWNGRDVSREEFVSLAWPFFTVTIVAAAGLVYALWTERRWVRELAVAGIVGLIVYQAWLSGFAVSVFGWIVAAIPVAITIWFWYFKDSIYDYYLLLEDPVDPERRSAATGSP